MEKNYIPYDPVSSLDADSVLIFAAHPDDEVFGCGGAIRKHVEAKVPTKVIIVTDGACGISGADTQQASGAAVRQHESMKAAEVLGYGIPTFWALPDRGLCYEESLIRKIMDAIKDIKPDLVYTPSPLEIHPDHRNLARSVLEALRRLDQEILLAMYEVGAPFRPNTLLDITDVWSYKEDAMGVFESQTRQQPYHRQIAGLNSYRTYTLPGHVTHAEAFFVLDSHEIKKGWLEVTDRLSFEYPLSGTQCAHPLDDQRMRQYGDMVSILIRSIGRDTLKDAIKSVEQQTYPNIEIVVVNAKGPGHVDIKSWNSRFPLRFIDSSLPLPRSRAANIALKKARGRFMMFLDDDDYLLPDHVHTLVEALNRDPEKLLAYSKIMCVGPDGESQGRIIGHDFDPTLLLAGNYIAIHATLFSSALLDAGIKMDTAFDLYEDWDFWIQAAQYSEFIFVPKVTACYRFGKGSGEGFFPPPEKRKKAIKALCKKWKFLWTKQKLAYIMERLGENNMDPTILEEVRRLLGENNAENSEEGNNTSHIAVVLHIYYEDLWPDIHAYLKKIPFKFQLFSTLSGPGAHDLIPDIKNAYPQAEISIVENKGRDILPFLRLLPKLIEKGYDCVLKLHTNKSTPSLKGHQWQLLEDLVGHEKKVKCIIERFKKDPTIGMLGPSSHFISCSQFIDVNHEKVLKHAQSILPNAAHEDWRFFAGSMFWFRPTAMLPLISLSLNEDDFEPEKGQTEETLAHAIERLFPIVVKAANYKVDVIKMKKPKTPNHYLDLTYPFTYPFAPKSSIYLLRERDRLKEQARQALIAKDEAERLARERLSEISKLDKQVKELFSALKKAEDIAINRLLYIEELENRLKSNQDFAINCLKKKEQLEISIRDYEMLASQLKIKLKYIANQWLWLNARKFKNVWNKIVGRNKLI